MLLLLVATLWSGVSLAATLTDGPFQIEYPDGQEAIAQQSAEILTDAAAALADKLPAGAAPIRVVICSTRNEFLRYAGIYTQTGVTGVARPEEGFIAVKAPSMLPVGSDYEGTLRHELIHVLLARNVNPDYLPRWLNEGITMTLSREHRWASRARIAQMYVQGQIIRYPDLNFAMAAPGSEMEFSDAYAQSLSMTRFLMDRLGEAAFWDLVLSLRTQDFDAALQHYAHFTPYEFWTAWHNSLWNLALVSTLVSGFSVFQAMALLVVFAYWRKRRRGQRILRAWEEEEGRRVPGDSNHADDEPWYPWDDDGEDEDKYRRW